MNSWISGNRFLSLAEMRNNAAIVRDYLTDMGWHINAICAVLGNMQTESSINPGIWENLTQGTGGYGLVQWTPASKYITWAGADYANGYRQLDRIIWEAEHGEQWFANGQVGMSPPISFWEFTTSDLDIETLSDYWLYFYEHPGDPYASRTQRRNQSIQWYEYLQGVPYTPGHHGSGADLWLIAYLKRRQKQWQSLL